MKWFIKKIAKGLFRIIEKLYPNLVLKLYLYLKGKESVFIGINEVSEKIPVIEKTSQKQPKIQNDYYYNQVYAKKENLYINPQKIDIAFIVPQPICGSGGHRNFYRAIKYLREFGHDITVYYMQTTEPADIIKQRVTEWFYDMTDIPYICYEGTLGYHDAVVATWWETAYMLRDNMSKVKYGFYFVQDFEPAFSQMGSHYILAECSYRLGFAHICSGKWCKDFLINKYQAEAEFFQFPVDKNIYNMNLLRTKSNKNIIFFAKPEMPRRCYEIGIMALREFHKSNPDIEIILFGSDHLSQNHVDFPVTVLGLLPSLNDLANLYRNADLGIVFSTTNPSLVPYEMLSCGCPVVDMDLEGALTKYGESNDNVFLCSPEPSKMAEQICRILDNEELLSFKSNKGREWVFGSFPTEIEMARMIENIIKNKVAKGRIEL